MSKYFICFSLGDAKFCVDDIVAETPRKAKYQAYKTIRAEWRINTGIDLKFIDFVRDAHVYFRF